MARTMNFLISSKPVLIVFLSHITHLSISDFFLSYRSPSVIFPFSHLTPPTIHLPVCVQLLPHTVMYEQSFLFLLSPDDMSWPEISRTSFASTNTARPTEFFLFSVYPCSQQSLLVRYVAQIYIPELCPICFKWTKYAQITSSSNSVSKCSKDVDMH